MSFQPSSNPIVPQISFPLVSATYFFFRIFNLFSPFSFFTRNGLSTKPSKIVLVRQNFLVTLSDVFKEVNKGQSGRTDEWMDAGWLSSLPIRRLLDSATWLLSVPTAATLYAMTFFLFFYFGIRYLASLSANGRNFINREAIMIGIELVTPCTSRLFAYAAAVSN